MHVHVNGIPNEVKASEIIFLKVCRKHVRHLYRFGLIGFRTFHESKHVDTPIGNQPNELVVQRLSYGQKSTSTCKDRN